MRTQLLILFFAALAASSSAEQRRHPTLLVTSVTPAGPPSDGLFEDQPEKTRSTWVQEHHFGWVDYSMLGGMLAVSILIGTFYGFFAKKQETADDFLLGGSEMGTFPMAMSLAASFVTAIELLGNPAEMYNHGTQFWMICLAFLFVVPIASNLYLPVFMKLRLTSSYEYLNLRFSKNCRLLASGLYMLQMILYTSVAVYAPALALSSVTGLNVYLAVTLTYVVCIFYASVGGMKAVIMTDSFQAAVLMISLFLILFWGSSMAGGWEVVYADSRDSGRLEFFNMDPNPTVRHTFWSVVIGGTFYWTTMFCSNQTSVQKYLSVSSISQVRKALWVSAVGLIMVFTINFMTGGILYSIYKGCDPELSGQISASDRLLPLYVMNYMGGTKGVPGLFVAGIFAASLGTVASAMNSMAAITCEDVLHGLFNIEIPPSKGAVYAKWLSAGFGVLSFALVFIVERLGPVLQIALSFNGMVGGVTLGLFSLGMFVPWANARGAMTGGIMSLLVVMWIGVGSQIASLGQTARASMPVSTEKCPCKNATRLLEPLLTDSMAYGGEEDDTWFIFQISYLWYSLIGFISTLLIGVVVSYCSGFQNPAELDVDLLSPPIRRLVGVMTSKPKTNSHPLGITNLALEIDDEKPRIEAIIIDKK